MKTIAVLFSFLISATSFAETRQILCQQSPGRTSGSVGIILDNEGLDVKSNRYRIKRVSWVYDYSNAYLICSDQNIKVSGVESLKCIGYSSAGGLIEISLNLNQSVGTVEISNVGDEGKNNIYAPQTDGMVLPCAPFKGWALPE